MIAELQKKVNDLTSMCAALSVKCNELQRQVAEASIVKQRKKRDAARNKVSYGRSIIKSFVSTFCRKYTAFLTFNQNTS